MTHLIEWEHKPSKRTDKEATDYWDGHFRTARGIAIIQGPSRDHKKYRTSTYLRWKDAKVKDHDTLEEAKQHLEQSTIEWIDGLGLQLKN